MPHRPLRQRQRKRYWSGACVASGSGGDGVRVCPAGYVAPSMATIVCQACNAGRRAIGGGVVLALQERHVPFPGRVVQ